MSDSRVEVLAVPEGSIVWLHNIDLAPGIDGDNETMLEGFLRDLKQQCGHSKFVILSTNGEGVVDVIGEDALAGRVRAALAR